MLNHNAMVRMSPSGPPVKRGRIDPQSLSQKEVELELAKESRKVTENKIILITVLNAHYPITVDVISRILKPIGTPDRIVIFQKFFVQSMVEFPNVSMATRAKDELHGCDIYAGCCTLKVEYAKTDRLNVHFNNDKTWDYTQDLPSGSKNEDLGGNSQANRRVLLDDRPPGGSSMRDGSSPMEEPFPGWNGNGNMGNQSMVGGAGGPNQFGSFGNVSQPVSGPLWGGGYNPHPQEPMQGGGSVLMLYQLDSDRYNCDTIFNLVCQYGNVIKVSFLKNKESCAMVEMSDFDAAERVLQNLNYVPIFGCKISIERSRKPFIEDIKKPHSLRDGTESYKNFSNCRKNRFSTQERAAKNRIIKPTRVLHFYNVPQLADEDVYGVFSSTRSPAPYALKWLEQKQGSKWFTGILEFSDVQSACEALALGNHYRPDDDSFEIKLCFSKGF